jgi:thiol-disulfide isomerase/thioredoxin
MTDSTATPNLMARLRNFVIVLVAIVLSTTVFLGLQSKSTSASLSSLAEDAVPLEVALTNGKPTLMEFYANWCTTCQAMAGDMSELKDDYSDRLNFVMLNVDNTKWLPEMLHYEVDGIPHFVFLSDDGQEIASTIGEQPKSIMMDNVDALIAGVPLPHLQARGRVSEVESRTVAPSSNDDPRSHGSQVVN